MTGFLSSGGSTAGAAENSISGMRKITIEEYFTTESLLAYVRSRVKSGAKYNSLFDYDSEQLKSGIFSEQRLKDMDEAGIDMQVISALPWHEGLVNPEEGTAMARMTNDEIAAIIQKYPGRFAGFAALACQDPEAATAELNRAVSQLGLKGAMIYSHIQGQYLDHPKFRPVFAMAEKLNVPIYLHPKGPSPDMMRPYQDYFLWGPTLGFAADTALHAMRLIDSGLFDEHPGLKMILGHAGEGLPFWLHRMGVGDMPTGGSGGDPRTSTGGVIPRPLCKKRPGQYILDNFYITPSGMLWEPVLMFLHTVLGADRMLFAVDYPAGSNIEGVRLIESLPISDKDKAKIFHMNTEKLLRL